MNYLYYLLRLAGEHPILTVFGGMALAVSIIFLWAIFSGPPVPQRRLMKNYGIQPDDDPSVGNPRMSDGTDPW